MNKLCFNNGKLTILQISDAQDMHWVRRTMLRMLESACDRVKPDLIVFTGDNILGNHLSDHRFSDGKRNLSRSEEYQILKKALRHILDIPTKRGIPFAMIFGNHDDRNAFTKDEQADIFRANSLNCGLENTGELCGTYCLPVYDSKGEKRLLNLWMLDTARYDKARDRCYEEITPAQVAFFREESEKLKRENGGKPYPSLVFMHIPFREITNLYEPCAEEDAAICDDGVCYRLKDGVEGRLGEPSSTLSEDNGMYQAILTDGGVKAIISGHDHRNCFAGEHDGIRFVATPCASFRCYGNTRGVRVFEIDERTPDEFYTNTLDYETLCGHTLKAKFGYFWDADEMEKKKTSVLGASAAVAAVSIGAAICAMLRKNES